MKIMGQTPHATNLRDLLILRAEYGEKPLLIIRDRILTYSDAARLSNIVANQLMKYGVRKGDVVATFMYNSLEQALTYIKNKRFIINPTHKLLNDISEISMKNEL